MPSVCLSFISLELIIDSRSGLYGFNYFHFFSCNIDYPEVFNYNSNYFISENIITTND
jgi:hypothetical protein